MVQEYGRYFDMPTACFRGGMPDRARRTRRAELHGFLAYLMRCAVSGAPYNVFGYKGKQVRDNIHTHDLVSAFDAFWRSPRIGEVYNIGGGRLTNCSQHGGHRALRSEITGKTHETSTSTRTASATTSGGSAATPGSATTTPSWTLDLRRPRHPA